MNEQNNARRGTDKGVDAFAPLVNASRRRLSAARRPLSSAKESRAERIKIFPSSAAKLFKIAPLLGKRIYGGNIIKNCARVQEGAWGNIAPPTRVAASRQVVPPKSPLLIRDCTCRCATPGVLRSLRTSGVADAIEHLLARVRCPAREHSPFGVISKSPSSQNRRTLCESVIHDLTNYARWYISVISRIKHSFPVSNIIKWIYK